MQRSFSINFRRDGAGAEPLCGFGGWSGHRCVLWMLEQSWRWTMRVLVFSNGSTCDAVFFGGLVMVDMWMLSVAAALVGPVEELNSVALSQLEEAVRAVPGLGDALDAARAADASDTIRLAEELANGLKAAYDGGGVFPILLDAVWPVVLFGPVAKSAHNVHIGTVHGNLIQLGAGGTVDFSGPPSSARSRFPFFGSGRRAKKHRP